MEKFQKYCLSVLLVIICGNISAQIINGSIGPNEYKKLCEIYTQLLDCQNSENTQESCSAKKTKYYHTIHHKQNVIAVIGKSVSEKQFGKIYQDAGFCFGNEREDVVLENFESRNKKSSLGTLYFKTKVSKIRNKDYLNLLG
ncbi:hypothetical protein [Chryseobacterium defluvii]|uniref:Uncharacterized protein n=1 Tax=Chryseobacterium defluvii TaxID=160396 RepID=A0A495SC66_9FLAO|nr:hypothetical protein [Chryseobacterium defluvii]RKS96736.1 hypothetical protein BCF58_3170 [Chryseobacterium defluvii]